MEIGFPGKIEWNRKPMEKLPGIVADPVNDAKGDAIFVQSGIPMNNTFFNVSDRHHKDIFVRFKRTATTGTQLFDYGWSQMLLYW